ncbi:hypothetical protein GGH96_001124 [Coemansia sp. RSA 1972]|nr:hypothetical protein GGH96_001124 [Coemansia sp. RSA 1972]
MHEKSTVEEKQLYQYMHNEKKANDKDIAALERTLSASSFIKPDLDSYKVYLEAREKVEAELTRHYNKMMCHQQVGAMTPEVPLHQKLQLSVFINWQQADQLLVNRLQKEFKPEESDPEPIFIMGNWLVSMTQFHEPIQGVV